MAWIITNVVCANNDGLIGTCDARGLDNHKLCRYPYHWQTRDGDGNLSAWGLATEESFAPLDFLCAELGDVTIEFRNRLKEWEVL